MTELDYPSMLNKKKAYLAMCKSTMLLFAFTFLSIAASYVLSTLFARYSVEIEGAVAKVFEMFGEGKQSAIATARQVIQSEAFFEFLKIVRLTLTMFIPTLVFAKCVKLSSDEYFCVKGRLVKGIVFVFCVCQLFTATASVLSQSIYSLLFPGFSGGTAVTYIYSFESGFDIFGFAFRILNVCIFVPIIEEFVFRGVIFSYLRKFGLSYAAVASAVLFGIAHGSSEQVVYAFVFGIFSAFLVSVTGNIKTSIILHSINNLVTVAISYIPELIGERLFDIIYCVYLALLLIFAFYGIYRIIVKDSLIETYKQKAKENDEKLCVRPGMREIIVLPLVMYVLYTIYDVVIGVLSF